MVEETSSAVDRETTPLQSKGESERSAVHDAALLARQRAAAAYRKFHNTETALVKITNDLLLSADERKVSILALLDLSAALTLRPFSPAVAA